MVRYHSDIKIDTEMKLTALIISACLKKCMQKNVQ